MLWKAEEMLALVAYFHGLLRVSESLCTGAGALTEEHREETWASDNHPFPVPSLDEFSGMETDTAIPTEEPYVIYDEGT